MARPGFVLEVDAQTPPLMCLSGADVRMQRFRPGTSVVYAPDAEPSADPVPCIDASLRSPVDGDPLEDRLQPGTRLTIVVSADHSLTPGMRFDVRRALVERVLETAARVGVDDVAIVIAGGLHRRWSASEISAALGDRVAASFLPDGLITAHDVEATDLPHIGDVDGHPVLLNERVATSDLVVEVGVRTSPATQRSLATSVTGVDTIAAVSGLQPRPELADAVNDLIESAVPVLSVLAVLGQPYFAPQLGFLNRREWEWRPGDHLGWMATRQLLAALPRRGARAVFTAPLADYPVLDVVAGSPAQTHREAGEVWRAGNGVGPLAPADVVIASAWGPDMSAGDPVGDPVAAAHHVLEERVGNSGGAPLVRPGGIVIGFHPLTPSTHSRTRGGTGDFFTTVLPVTRDVDEIHAHHEPRVRRDHWYLEQYRSGQADHPLRALHSWYRAEQARSGLGDVIWVGGDRRVAELLGHRAATTLADALEIARASVGDDPAVTFLRAPGRVVGFA